MSLSDPGNPEDIERVRKALFSAYHAEVVRRSKAVRTRREYEALRAAVRNDMRALIAPLWSNSAPCLPSEP